MALMSTSGISPTTHVVQECAQLRTCIRSKGIRDRTLCPVAALDGVDDGHIIRIACSLVSMVLYNGQFVWAERSPAVNVSEPTIQKGKIGCEPSALQVSYSFCHGHDVFAASPAHQSLSRTYRGRRACGGDGRSGGGSCRGDGSSRIIRRIADPSFHFQTFVTPQPFSALMAQLALRCTWEGLQPLGKSQIFSE